MINRLLDLNNKTDEFEQYLSSFEKFQNKLSKKSTCISCIRNFSDLEIILPKKILITKLDATENSKIFFQCLLDLNLNSNEDVEFSFIVNDISIYKSKKSLLSGSNQICVMQNYVPLTTEQISVYIEITPVNGKSVFLYMASLFMWGNFEEVSILSYNAIEIYDKYLISIIDNNCLYYTKIDKIKKNINFLDLTYLNEAISHCFIYSSKSDITYLFRVDTMGNLFYSDFLLKNEIYITNNVSNVSASISNDDIILVSYIKNNVCYYCEIIDEVVSVHKKISCGNIKIANCYSYYNKFRNTFCIVLTSNKDNNYFIEQVKENDCRTNNLSVNYNISINLIN